MAFINLKVCEEKRNDYGKYIVIIQNLYEVAITIDKWQVPKTEKKRDK